MVKFGCDTEATGLGRRGALAGLFAFAAAATMAGPAMAGPAPNVRRSAAARSPAASPDTDTIASPPTPGYAYRTLWYNDFLPLDPSANARTFGGAGGFYSDTGLQAAVEIPAGALLRSVEWFVANTSGSNMAFYAQIWTPTDAYITQVVTTIVPSSASSTPTMTLGLTTSDNWGPYPEGSKIVLYAPTTPTCLLNGVRLGFTGGGLETNIRPAPLKLYDSATTGGKFAAGETRTITLPGVPAGTTAVILRIITTGSTAAGTVKVFPANQPEPDVGAADIGANTESVTEATIYMIANRQVKIRPSRAAHVRFDLVGWHR
ncbi:hypothetical protein IHQ68_16020 [Chelatococcus sambhunathii]|uniref:Uncharacterized protein n=1 Tax=Chelatococcus sambhunathii TaxID=363953 RepID=A0ABU1DJ26_9HYPH|nr:hypothetical protein [Chelatococcus sambhunathii]MDR4308127.1 hypothetical protein [Chelatococcus sambhunathii]